MTVIEAVEKDKYKLESMSKNLLLGLLKRAYNEGLEDGQKSIRVRLANITHAILEDEEEDG